MPARIQPPARSRFANVILEFKDADAEGKPFSHARVRVDLLGADGNPSGTLVQGRANSEGKLLVRIPVPKAVADQPPNPLPRIQVSVLDLDGDELRKLDIQPEADKPTPPIKVSDGPQRAKISALLNDGGPVLGRKLSPKLSELLKRHKVDSLASLRKAQASLSKAALEAFDSLREQDRRDWAELTAHAQLQLASRNHETNRKLINAGYRSVLAIARESRNVFVANVKAQANFDAALVTLEATAIKLHDTARRQVQALANLHMEEQARQANGMKALSVSASAVEPPCECSCGSAVSPQAYLVDLLDYAVDNVRFNGSAVDLPRLETTFGQPFAALPVDCAFADVLVRQVRLCVEVLQRRNTLLLANAARATAVTSALNAHAATAYEALLRALGTSYRWKTAWNRDPGSGVISVQSGPTPPIG